ncbi:hypothetical protein G9P44_000887 [Scheffersomyces stipitis]|nr:hypothetical protein G9P44_000887 [Scheffersomyces stipitis]
MPFIFSPPRYISQRHCGYCNGKKTDHYALESQKKQAQLSDPDSIIIGTSITEMSCSDYDELINQGFRRSGTFLYKPDMLRTCCRYYTIRTDMSQLKLTKQHRKVVNRFIKAISENNEEPQHKNQKEYDLTGLLQAESKSKRFYTRYETSEFTPEKFALYKKYQISVHNDKPEEVTEASFDRFLCETPFPDEEIDGSSEEWDFLDSWIKNWKPSQKVQYDHSRKRRIGPTHECYYLDDKLIAISVLDFLPTGVSSIYFIWDPDYAHLSLGTLSGLREILMCRELSLGYYYLGYYIDDCPKMNYKSKFGGELLDLVNEVYVPLSLAKPWIANDRLFVLGREEELENEQVEYGLDNDGHPLSLENSRFASDEVVNIAEKVYGEDAIFEKARTAMHILITKHEMAPQDKNSPYTIPEVMPGLIPLWKIVDMFETGVLSDTFPVSIIMSGRLQRLSLGKLNDVGRQLVIDCARLFGPRKIRQGILNI